MKAISQPGLYDYEVGGKPQFQVMVDSVGSFIMGKYVKAYRKEYQKVIGVEFRIPNPVLVGEWQVDSVWTTIKRWFK